MHLEYFSFSIKYMTGTQIVLELKKYLIKVNIHLPILKPVIFY